jgi:hypothetical protein
VASGRLVVALYAAVDMRELVPVQTSIGRPRWVPFEVVPWPTVMPWGLVGKVTDRGQFRTAYRRRLHQRRPRIVAEVAELLDAYDLYPVALACYENLAKPDAWCRRTLPVELLGEWLAVEIPDLERW